MDVSIKINSVNRYKSPSQKIRVITESWVSNNAYCPNCGNINIDKYQNNKPVADFFCSHCKEEYELKSKKNTIGNKIVDGAYRSMTERLISNTNPNLLLLNYDLIQLEIKNFYVIPKYFFIPDIIEIRKPLSPTARRAGWIGCNILIQEIPEAGKIYLIKDSRTVPKEKVLADWKRTLFLREEKDANTKGWLFDVMNCIEKIGKTGFTINEIYSFETSLQEKHKSNKHIKAKIRQQLQILRDKNFLEFTGRGKYTVKNEQ